MRFRLAAAAATIATVAALTLAGCGDNTATAACPPTQSPKPKAAAIDGGSVELSGFSTFHSYGGFHSYSGGSRSGGFGGSRSYTAPKPAPKPVSPPKQATPKKPLNLNKKSDTAPKQTTPKKPLNLNKPSSPSVPQQGGTSNLTPQQQHGTTNHYNQYGSTVPWWMFWGGSHNSQTCR